MKSIKGQIVDIFNRTIYPGEVVIEKGKIKTIIPTLTVPDHYIMPGFIDAHIHIESSMLVPYEFAKMAMTHGTVATISDPHEIANVLGVEGVRYMIENAQSAKLKFHFGAPSCVPATSYETAGAVIDSNAVKELLALKDIYYLSEMMNYPGVLHGDPEVLKKVQYAKELNKPIDGHAPGLREAAAKAYIDAGITTDHECYTLDEAKEKLALGMKVIIREGSAAKNFEALHPMIKKHARDVMFCSDDKHPDDLMLGHINLLVQRALKEGYDLYDVLHIACVNPVEHYNMRSGLLRRGDAADFIVVKDLNTFEVLTTCIDGEEVVAHGKCMLPSKSHTIVNQFNTSTKKPEDFSVKEEKDIWPVIQVIDGELITEKLMTELPYDGSVTTADIKRDILKIAVINRYRVAPISLGFIQNFGLTSGAIASTVAHDSHNIIVVGVDDISMTRAVNLLIQSKGGLSVVDGDQENHLPLPIAGLMSDLPCDQVAQAYEAIDQTVKKMGCQLKAPFMSLSFMALLVIPKIKMSDLGMFDAEAFEFY